jgi:Tfp pilus assembly protein PilF
MRRQGRRAFERAAGPSGGRGAGARSEPESLEVTALLQQGLGFLQAGRLAEAEAACAQILKIAPNRFDVLILLAFIYFQRADYQGALHHIDRALKLQPDNAEAFFNRGLALHKLDRLDDAVASYDRALALKHDYAEAFYNRGHALHAQNRLDEALASYDRAVALRPGAADAFNNRGNTLLELKRLDEALASYERAIALKPDFAEAFVSRGVALHKLDRLEDAVASYDRAIALKPDNADAFYNRGFALQGVKRLDEALASYDRAIMLRPNFGEAFNHRAMCRLLAGRYRDGWADYEWRWSVTKVMAHRPNFVNWQGEELNGRSLLVFSEQGLGDIILFARYLSLLDRVWCRPTFLARPNLVRLLQPLMRGVEVITSVSAERTFDFQCALMSLPRFLGIDIAPLPGTAPYLHAEDGLIDRWRARIGAHGFKVGICWQCNPAGPEADHRAIPLRYFQTLGQISGVRLICLQKFDGLEQLAQSPVGMVIETLGDDFDAGPDAMVDCAAVMRSVDLVVTCDTAIAHLAGALGVPVWLALRFVPHWPWLLDRPDTPWYRPMRLFRQRTRGVWDQVFDEIANELTTLASNVVGR